MTATGPMAQDATLVQSAQARVFIQEEGINGLNPYVYYGQVQWDKASIDLGKVTPVYLPSPLQRNKWRIVDRIRSAPTLGKGAFLQHADRYLRDVWWKLKDRGCTFNLQVVMGECQRPDQLAQWDSRLLFSHVVLESLDTTELNALDGEKNMVTDLSGNVSFEDMIPLRSLLFEPQAGATLLSEILDGLWYDTPQCGSCGPASDGCQKLFLLSLANAGSPGLSSQIYYSIDGGSTFAALDIPTLGGLSGNRMAGMGDKLVVISQAKANHQWILFSDVLAGNTLGWTAVATGYVATKGPRCIYERNVNQAWIGAAGGYIYYMTDPTVPVTVSTDNSLTTQDLNDIHGVGRTIVAVGNSNVVLYSNSEGNSWQLLTGPAVGQVLTTIWCISQNVWFVGTNNGKLYTTVDAGATWTQINFGAVAVVNDVQFWDDTVGYMSVEVTPGNARVYRTLDSGFSWQYTKDSVAGFPTNWNRINVVLPCGWNECAAVGRVTSGGLGALALGLSRPD